MLAHRERLRVFLTWTSRGFPCFSSSRIHICCWRFAKPLVSKGFFFFFLPLPIQTHMNRPQTPGYGKSFTSQLHLSQHQEWMQISAFWHKFLPPQRGDVLIRQASVFLVNDEQFVLQLSWLHRKTFEENVWQNKRLGEKVNTLKRTWKLSCRQIFFLSCDEMTFFLKSILKTKGPLLNYFPPNA